MEISVDKQPNAYGLLKLKLEESDYKPEFTKKLNEYSKKMNLKGFRPGKVPTGVVNKMYGKDIKAEVVNDKISKSIDAYLKENEVNLLFQPRLKGGETLTPEFIRENKEFDLEFELCIEPELDINLTKRLKVQGFDLQVSDEDVDAQIEKMVDAYPEVKEVETSEQNDILTGTFKKKEGEFEKNSVLALEKVSEENQAAFIGKKVGDVVEFDASIIGDDTEVRVFFGVEEDAVDTVKGAFELTIEKIERSTPAELNQVFFDKVLGEGTVSDEAGFKAELKIKMQEGNAASVEGLVNNDVQKLLLDKYPVELPEELLSEILAETATEEKKELTEEEKAGQLDNFKRAIQWRVISSNLAKAADVKIEFAEIREEAKANLLRSFSSYGMPFDDAQLDGFVDNYLQMENGKYYNEAHENVFNAKVTEYAKSKIAINTEVVSIKQLDEIIQKRNEELAAAQA